MLNDSKVLEEFEKKHQLEMKSCRYYGADGDLHGKDRRENGGGQKLTAAFPYTN